MTRSTEEDIKQCQASGTLLPLVADLGDDLTSEDDALRHAGVLHLARVVASCASTVQENERATLATFFAEKITDRGCISGALQGSKALLQADSNPQEPCEEAEHDHCDCHAHESGLPREVLYSIEKAVLRGLPIASLSQENRHHVLQILLLLAQVHPQAMLEGSISWIDGVSQAIDGERDPRCLLLGFELLRRSVQLYQTSGQRFVHVLEQKAEDVCDVVTCYFPITFRLPPNSSHGITRELLADTLEETLCCSRLFAPFVLPLVLEKLSSAVWRAKVDALKTLARVYRQWGPGLMSGHSARIWWGLRDELLDPTNPAGDQSQADPTNPTAAPDETKARGSTEALVMDTRAAARACLEECLAAESQFEPEIQLHDGGKATTLLQQVLKDDLIVDLPQTLVESDTAGESATTSKQVASANLILTAVCAASEEAGEKVLQQLMPSLMTHSNSGNLISEGLALSSILAILKGWAEGRPRGSAPDHDATGPKTPSKWGQDILKLVLNLPAADSGTDKQRLKVALLRVRILAQLASFQGPTHQPLSQGEQQEAAGQLLGHIQNEASAPEVAHAAAFGLVQIAGAGSGQVCNRLLPDLVTASKASNTASGSAESGSSSLVCLVEIAKASSELRARVLQILADAALQLLQQSNFAASERFLNSIQKDVLPACKQPLQGEEASAASQLACQLMTSFTQSSEGTVPSDFITSAGHTTQAVACFCSPQDQLAIAQAAVQSIVNTESGRVLEVASVLACSAVIGLQPEVKVVDGAQSRVAVLRLIMNQSLRAKAGFDEVLMAAAASMLLKWPPSSGEYAESIDEAADVALDEIVLPSLQLQVAKADACHVSRAICLLGWIAKALAMRQHPRREKPIETAVAYLEAASLDLAAAQNPEEVEDSREADQNDSDGDFQMLDDGLFDAGEACAMAQIFGTVMSPGSGLTRLDERTHARGRILWQQKVYTEAFSLLEEKIAEGLEFLGHAPGPLLLALLKLTSACPSNIVKTTQHQLLPWLVLSLNSLTEGPLQDSAAVEGALTTLSAALGEDTGRRLLEPCVEDLLEGLLTTASYNLSPEVRVKALQALALVMKLPYHLLHPFRSKVLATLGRAVDDSKRSVRFQAGKTRRVWLPGN